MNSIYVYASCNHVTSVKKATINAVAASTAISQLHKHVQLLAVRVCLSLCRFSNVLSFSFAIFPNKKYYLMKIECVVVDAICIPHTHAHAECSARFLGSI